MALARRLQRARPRPTPGLVWAASLADLWKGLKRRFCSERAIPSPWSQTWMLIFLFLTSARRVISLP